MTYESERKKTEKDLAGEEEFYLLIKRTEAIVRIIELEEGENKMQILGNDPIFREQLIFIRDALKELSRKLKEKNIQEKIQKNVNLTHEIGNFEVYLNSFSRLRKLQEAGKNIEELLSALRRKTDEFYNYLIDITHNIDLFENEIQSTEHYQKVA